MAISKSCLLFAVVALVCIAQVFSASVLVEYTVSSLKVPALTVFPILSDFTDDCDPSTTQLQAQKFNGGLNLLSKKSTNYWVSYDADQYAAHNCTVDSWNTQGYDASVGKLSISVLSTDYNNTHCAGYNSEQPLVIDCTKSECLVGSCGAGAMCYDDNKSCPNGMKCEYFDSEAYICSASLAKMSAGLLMVLFAILAVYFS